MPLGRRTAAVANQGVQQSHTMPIALGLRNSGTLRIPVGLAPSPFCAPARPNGRGFAHPVPSCQRFSSVDRYPIGDSRRELEKLKAFENIRQKNILNQVSADKSCRLNVFVLGKYIRPICTHLVRFIGGAAGDPPSPHVGRRKAHN